MTFHDYVRIFLGFYHCCGEYENVESAVTDA